jgi:anti-sigma regulatory factor (Ser/Thr protein kinase)
MDQHSGCVSRESVLPLLGRRDDGRAVRSFLRDVLPGLGWAGRVDDACLIATELVANVALHARTAGAVKVTAKPDRLRIEVFDNNPTLPRLLQFSDAATTGRGLRVVDRLADAWGAEGASGGKTVWFLLSEKSELPV